MVAPNESAKRMYEIYPDTQVLVVSSGVSVRTRGYNILVKDKNGSVLEVPIVTLRYLIIYGVGVNLSSGVIAKCIELGIPIIFASRKANGVIHSPFIVAYSRSRKAQAKVALDPIKKRRFALELIRGKLLGMVNLARYFAYKLEEQDRKSVLEELTKIATSIKKLSLPMSDSELIHLEADFSRSIWRILSLFIPKEYDFPGRKPRNRDPINSAIDYGYSILYGLVSFALATVGLDPYMGLLHVDRPGRASLTYDVSEPFKPVIQHAIVVASRRSRIKVNKMGYLTKRSLKIVTAEIMRKLHVPLSSTGKSIKQHIFTLADSLKQAFEKDLLPPSFTYQP